MPALVQWSRSGRARTILPAAIAVLAAAVVAVPPASAQLRDLLPFGRAHRIATLLPTVVNIETLSFEKDATDASAAPRRVEHFASGFIVDASGLVVTNHHAVDGVSEINITLSSGTTLKAKVIGDAGFNVDLALLKIDPEKPLPVVKWGDSRKVRVGDAVFAIGNPLGVGESVSAGIVSGLNRNISETPYDDFIQTDAAINHGNSGGPLVDMRGDVIGVNTAIYSPTDAGSIGLGFSIPSNDVQFVIDRLRKFGRLKFGYLGVRLQDVNADMADALGMAKPSGAIVASVVTDGPGQVAGIKEGDVILKFGEQVPTDIRALRRMIAIAKIGETIPLSVWRDGRAQTMSATIAEWPDEAQVAKTEKPAPAARLATTNPDQLGLHLAPITDDGRAKFKLAAGVNGVLVTDITHNSTASDQGLAAGDVIVKVQFQPVSTPEEVQKALVDALAQNHHHALLLVQKPEEREWVSIPIGAPPPASGG